MKLTYKRAGSCLCWPYLWLSLCFLTGISLGSLSQLSAQVTVVGSEDQINTTTANSQQNPAVAMDSTGNYIIVWESFGTDGSGQGIYGQQYFSTGNKKGAEFKLNTTTAEDQRFPAVAMDRNGNSLVVWMDEAKDGSAWGIYGQRYDNSSNNNQGGAVGSEFLINSTTAGHQKFPDIAMNANGSHVVVWQEVALDGSSFQIKAQRYDATGNAQGGEIAVDTAGSVYQGYPEVAMDALGNFVIAWQMSGPDGSGMGVFARRFSNAGSPQGGSFQVNTTTAGNQQAPAVGMDASGSFSIAWSSYGQDGDAEGIYAQRYDASGSSSGSEFKVNSTTISAQSEPQIAMDKEGGFSIAWSSYGQDSSFTGVYFKAFSANGDSLDTEFRVNTRTTDFQQFPALAQSSFLNDLVIVWQDGLYNSTATHDGSNYGIYSQRYQTFDNQAPIAICQNLSVDADQGCSADVNPAQLDNGSSDPEGGSIFFILEPMGPYDIGVHPVNFIVGDLEGLFDTCKAIITVNDVSPPVPFVSPLPTITAECNVSITPPEASDNCAGNVFATTNDPLTYSVEGSYTINWTFSDTSGNSITESQTVIIDDSSAPVPDQANLPTITAECSATVPTPTATDNCAGQFFGTTNDPTSYSIQGSFIINWNYNDGNGNVSTQEQTVIVNDVTAPLPDLSNLPTITVECGTTISAPTATDNCSGSITATTTDPLSFTTEGSFQINWTYDDGNGNTSSQSQTVIVDDVTAPLPDIANLPQITGVCTTTVSLSPTATDNCAGSIVGTTNDPLTYTEAGSYTLSWTYDDGNGNISSQQQTVIVEDNKAPVPDLASLPTVTGECSATVSSVPTATDNCGPTINGTTTDPLTYTTQGSFVINWTYEDGNGNIATQQQTVIVNDQSAPLPDLANLPTITGECSATITTVPTATDNCAGTINGTTSDPLSYNTQGTYVINWIFDDGNGNTISQQQSLIINDNSAPVPGPAITTVGECSVSLTPPTAQDNCAGTVTATSSDPTSYTVVGTYSVNWIFDDGNGNISQRTDQVIVEDNTPPSPDIGILPDIIAECSVSLTAPSATDNCDGSIVATTSDPTSYTTQGSFVVTWAYTDQSGNVINQLQNVIIDDVSPPSISNCPGPQNIPMDPGMCSGTVPDLTSQITATDNCGQVTISQTPLAGSSFGQEHGDNLSVNLVVDDGNGNIESCKVTLSLQDTQTPVLEDCPEDLVLCGEQAVFWPLPAIADNCPNPLLGASHQPGDVFPVGTTTVSYTVSDRGGNSVSCSFDVIIHPLPEVVIEQDILPDFCQGLAKLTANVLNTSSLLLPISYDWNNGSSSDPSLTVTENGSYTLTVTDARGCSITESIVVNEAIEDLTSAYSLIARNGIDFYRSTLTTGGAGVIRNNRRARFYNRSEVSSFVKAPIIQKFGGSTIANEILGRANLTLPTFKANVNPSSNNIVVQPGQTRVLNGSSYGRITVFRNATLVFNNPEVYIRDLLTYRQVDIVFNQSTELMVDRFIDLGNRNNFNVGGEQVNVYTEREFISRWGSTVIANVYAQRNIEARTAFQNNPTQMIGMFISQRKIRSWNFVEWNANPNCDFNFTPSSGNREAPQILSEGEDWNLYPNPASDLVLVEIPTYEVDVEISIYDLNGRKMLSKVVKAGTSLTRLDVSGPYFMNAIYVVQVEGENIRLSKKLHVMKQ